MKTYLKAPTARAPAMNSLNNRLHFFISFLRSPQAIGSITPSSRFLSEALSHTLPEDIEVIIELGAGCGAITKSLLAQTSTSSQGVRPDIICYEPHPQMSLQLAKNCPTVSIKQSDALGCIYDIKDAHSANKPCSIISSLPLTTLSRQYAQSVLDKTAKALETGESFSCYFYLHTIFLPQNRWILDHLKHHYAKVELKPVFLNFPPALLVKCTK